jgi:hypothetical protein
MTVLISGGDSFTFGNELADCDDLNPSIKTWSALLAKEFSMKYCCTAWGGYSNSSIARSVINACENFKKHDIAVAVMWSFPNRYEFKFVYDTKQRMGKWGNINPWTTEKDDNVILNAFHNASNKIFKAQKKNIQNAHETGVAEFAEVFTKHVASTGYWEMYTTYKEIVFLQDWLDSRDIPYLFTYVDGILFNNDTLIKPDRTIKTLWSSINLDNWYRFDDELGFYHWAKKEKFPFATTHPLEPAHEEFKNRILYLATELFT